MYEKISDFYRFLHLDPSSGETSKVYATILYHKYGQNIFKKAHYTISLYLT